MRNHAVTLPTASTVTREGRAPLPIATRVLSGQRRGAVPVWPDDGLASEVSRLVRAGSAAGGARAGRRQFAAGGLKLWTINFAASRSYSPATRRSCRP